MGHRLPTILGKAIDDVIRTLNEQSGEDEIIDLVQCIERMNVLMTELSQNAILRPIIDGMLSPTGLIVWNPLTPVPDDESDVALWNKEIAKYMRSKTLEDYLCAF